MSGHASALRKPRQREGVPAPAGAGLHQARQRACCRRGHYSPSSRPGAARPLNNLEPSTPYSVGGASDRSEQRRPAWQVLDIPLKAPLPEGCHLVSTSLNKALQPVISGVTAGMVNLFLQDGGCSSLCLNEKCDPAVQSDLAAALGRVFSPASSEHPVEAAGAKAVAMGQSLDMPVVNGQLGLGSYQGIYLCDWGGDSTDEHCSSSRRMLVTLQELGDARDVAMRTFRVDCRGSAGGVEAAASKELSLSGGSGAGLMHMMVKHTSASMALHAAAAAGGLLEAWASAVVPDEWSSSMFVHNYEGLDDMPAHVKQALLGASVAVPVAGGALAFTAPTGNLPHLWEHRNMRPGGCREVAYTLQRGAVTGQHLLELGTLALSSTSSSSPSSAWRACSCRREVADAVRGLLLQDGHGTLHLYISTPGAAVVTAPVLPSDNGTVSAADLVLTAVERLEKAGGLEEKSAATAAGVAAVLGASLTLPVRNGELALHEMQDLVLCVGPEVHTSRPVELVMTLQADPS